MGLVGEKRASVRDAEGLGVEVLSQRRDRWEYAVLVDLQNGDPPRRVEYLVWDDEHKALLIEVD